MDRARSFHFPAAAWRKACHANNTCVEVARITDDRVGARDGKQGEASPVIRFTPDEWRSFTHRIRTGDV
ncbi:DUF397 domain-containing protein [Thermomonospora umbrina]|uniref:Uncharacterized protein DUF397 n=1 Tax=Thermomonospora umbrina TaxID=111806 RepID=A0A3D9T039_9ACTN|nr:DUF397 domain-containing protein [Thermomonospora umbrina]REE98174.1 uncharacterized protein DUF397 [Thermomonospora umbrina]